MPVTKTRPLAKVMPVPPRMPKPLCTEANAAIAITNMPRLRPATKKSATDFVWRVAHAPMPRVTAR